MERSIQLQETTFQGILEVAHRLTHINTGRIRRQMLESRLRTRLRELACVNFESYLSLLQNSTEEHEAFIELVTTHETYFFRTQRIWSFLQTKWIPS